jgi:low temperature requirement protein LtrA
VAERPRLALIVFGYLHLFLLLGIVFVATGLKKAIPEPFDSLSTATAVALAVGAALFIAADAAMLRLLRIAQGPLRTFAAVAVLAAIPVGVAGVAALEVVVIAAIIAAALALEQRADGILGR